MANTGEKVVTAAEGLADYAIEMGFNDASDAVEGFAETLLDGLADGCPTIKFDYDEEDILMTALCTFVSDALVGEANELINTWNAEAREDYYAREEGRRGNY